MYITKQELESALSGTQNRKAAILKMLSTYGNHRLMYRIKNNRIYYTDKCNGKEVGISKNTARVYELMMKEFLKEQLKLLECNEKSITKCLKYYRDINVESVLRELEIRFPKIPVKDILLHYKNDWGKQPYTKNPYYPENLKYLTTNGVVVRSKSEREIANALESVGLQYQNDVLIQCGNENYYADFLIQRADKTTVIWEHFGREHDKVYMAKNMQRLKDYVTLGYRPWDNLIWTLESDLEDSTNIRKIINRFLLHDINK